MAALTTSLLEQFRQQKDQFFRTHPQSPLAPDQRATFTGLRYFPEDASLRFVVPIEQLPEQSSVVLQTSTGEAVQYVRYGNVHVQVEGEPVELTVYAHDDTLFLPFADGLAGSETYGAGRYLEPELLDDNRVLIDFNLAYNPYCAYNEQWSCPITPRENRVAVAIRAGEKLFKPEG